MDEEAQIILTELRKLHSQQRLRWKQGNALVPGVVPRALGLIHARAAWDINYAKRLVFDHFQLEGLATVGSDKDEMLDAVRTCLEILQQDLEDQFAPSEKDWKRLEEVASL